MTHENIEIPNTLPAMTLRGVVLFPSAMMPLRIFEPRYREMLNDVLSQDRMFAIVREREDVSAEEVELELPYSVATAGLVRISRSTMTEPPLFCCRVCTACVFGQFCRKNPTACWILSLLKRRSRIPSPVLVLN